MIKFKILSGYLFGIPMGIIIFFLLFYFNILDNLKIIFYRGLILILIASIIQFISLIFFFRSGVGKYINEAIPHAISITMICITFNITYFIIVPVSLDRSVSVFLLGYMAEKNSSVTKNDLEKAFNEIYVVRYKAIDRRLDEQISSGNLIEITPGNYQLTSVGVRFIELSKFTANIFNIDDKFINPKLN